MMSVSQGLSDKQQKLAKAFVLAKLTSFSQACTIVRERNQRLIDAWTKALLNKKGGKQQ
jgi:hypothetical protein